MRYYFHLILHDGQIDDLDGRLVDSLDHAKEEAKIALDRLVAEALVPGNGSVIPIGITICSDVAEVALIMVDTAVEKAFRARRPV